MNALYEEILAEVENEIRRIDLPNTPEKLYDPIRYILSLGGKRIRPVLTLLGCQLMGKPYREAMPQAMAVEVFHNFTLVHDDIMDSADVRRKLQTVHKKWDHNVALLSGDAMLVVAYQLLFQTSAEKAKPLADLFSKTAVEVCEGQQLDMDYADTSVTLDEYLHMIRLKTAVLLSGAMKLGGIVAEADETQLNLMTHFTESMGLAFQVKDDYLDAFGSSDFGKVKGGDIMEGKRTWLTVKSMEIASDAQRNSLERAFTDLRGQERVDQVLEIYATLNIDKLAHQEVERYSADSMKALEALHGEAKAKETLLWLVDQLVGRTT